jgi:peptidoglycan hydrolase CwlO-like protein
MLFEAISPYVNKQSYLRDLSLREGEVKLAEKKLANLKSDKAKLEKQIEKLKAELEATNKAIADQTGALGKLKAALEAKKVSPPDNLPGN